MSNITLLGVSIPFKRESVSKVKCLITRIAGIQTLSFNSLQTGKRIQRHPPQNRYSPSERFNSLQTGKRIQSKDGRMARDA